MGRAKETLGKDLCLKRKASWGNIQGTCVILHVKLPIKYISPISLLPTALDLVHSAALMIFLPGRHGPNPFLFMQLQRLQVKKTALGER